MNKVFENQENILLRCDASSMVGFGHLMRCISIAEAGIEKNINSIFLISENSNNIQKLMSKTNFKCFFIDDFLIKDQIKITTNICSRYNIKHLILDISNEKTFEKLNFYSRYINNLLDSNYDISIIDGTGDENLSSKLKLENIKIFLPYLIPKNQISKFKNCRLFNSLSYFPIRKEFINAKKKQTETKNLNFKLLISLSGINLQEKILLIVNAINRFKEYKINIIIMGKIDSEINSFHNIKNIEITNSIAEIMEDVDLMIIGSGLIRYEALFMEIPSLIFSLKSEHNQMVEFFSKFGTSLYGGEIEKLSEDDIFNAISSILKDRSKLKNMSNKCKDMIDSQGGLRLINAVVG